MKSDRTSSPVGFDLTSAVAIFVGAFLLFLIQPMIGKMILPWFGGTPAVWTTCMLFFQVVLLSGYAYAAVLTRWKSPVWQAVIHSILLVAALLMLPITPNQTWKPPDGLYPTYRILGMLLCCVGWPYFLLSATSPLIQSWFSHVHPQRSPYRLYTLSNIGSLGALLLYPFVFEPALTIRYQGWLWSGTFAFYVGVFGLLVFQIRGHRTAESASKLSGQEEVNPKNAALESHASQTFNRTSKPSSRAKQKGIKPAARIGANALDSSKSTSRKVSSWKDRCVWVGLPALASMMLLAVTNFLCQDVAVIPFLWILPLALYLISLIICFDHDRWYVPRWFALGTMIAILFVCDIAYLEYLHRTSDTAQQSRLLTLMSFDVRLVIAVYLTLFFMICMVCHGQVVRCRPRTAKLTDFYLSVSAGGALGGTIVAILCPLFLPVALEFNVGLVLSFVLGLWVFLVDGYAVWFSKFSKSIQRLGLVLAIPLVLAVVIAQWLSVSRMSDALPFRNFYGVLSVREYFPHDPERRGLALYHGATLHGYQYLDESKKTKPTTYYTAESGVGRALRAVKRDDPLHIGVVGLGVGTLSSYGKKGDRYRFYEINPLVIELAQSSFSFLRESKAQIDVVSGDARLSMEREEPQEFDVLVLDAFSSDAIPVHLLTQEAMKMYLGHLKKDGVIAVHVSNRYVNLASVVYRLSEAFHLNVASIQQTKAEYLELSPSDWILLCRDKEFLERQPIREATVFLKTDSQLPIWTDQYNNLFSILRRPQ